MRARAIALVSIAVLAGLVAVRAAACAADPPAQPKALAGKDEPRPVNGLSISLNIPNNSILVLLNDREMIGSTFTVVFANAGEKPLKLDAYDMAWSKLRLDLRDAAGKSAATVQLTVERHLGPPAPGDYLTIEPGKTWTFVFNLMSATIGYEEYLPLKPGEYRAKITYSAKPFANPSDFQKVYWTGTVTSSEVKFSVVEKPRGPILVGPQAAGGQPVNGLKLTLSAEKTRLKPGKDGKEDKTELTLSFTNVGGKAIKLDAYDLAWSRLRLDVTDSTGRAVPAIHRAIDRRVAPPAAGDYPAIEPGKSWAFRFSFPADTIGFRRYSSLKPGEHRLKLTYTAEAAANPPELQKGIWTGTVTSNELRISVVGKQETK